MNRPAWALVLAALYLVVLASVQWGDIAVAALTGAVVSAVCPAFGSGNPIPLLRFLAAVTSDAARSTLKMLRVLLHVKGTSPGYLQLPRAGRSRAGVAASGWALTLTPGSVFVRAEGQHLLLHVIDVAEREQTVKDAQRIYEQYQKRVIP